MASRFSSRDGTTQLLGCGEFLPQAAKAQAAREVGGMSGLGNSSDKDTHLLRLAVLTLSRTGTGDGKRVWPMPSDRANGAGLGCPRERGHRSVRRRLARRQVSFQAEAHRPNSTSSVGPSWVKVRRDNFALETFQYLVPHRRVQRQRVEQHNPSQHGPYGLPTRDRTGALDGAQIDGQPPCLHCE